MKWGIVITGYAVVAAMLLVAACDRSGSRTSSPRCVLSDRAIHPGMAVRIEAEEGGPSGDACCLACVMTHARQMGDTVRVVSVTDSESHDRLRPEDAVYVIGSSVRRCADPAVEVPAGRREALERRWDRCLPTVIAFAHREDAERFRKGAGGVIRTFEDLVAGTKVTAAE